MEKTDSDSDVGDLGLGDGLKPGGLPKVKLSGHSRKMYLHSHGMKRRNSREDSYSDSDVASAAEVTSKTNRFLQRIRRRHKNRQQSDGQKQDNEDTISDKLVDDLTNLALCSNLAIGTSMHEQRALFEKDLKELMQSDAATIKEVKADDNGKAKITELDNDAVKKKLQQTQEARLEKKLTIKMSSEVEVLKQELELCEKQLDAKYKAIKILQGQGGGGDETKTAAMHSREVTEKNYVTKVNRELQKQINSVQFELEYRQSCLLSSQELWAERFDSVCQENVRLARELEQKALDMKKLHAEKMVLRRDRDELLALVDIQERQRFESLKSSQSSEDSNFYNNFSTLELAVLGACQCRSMDPEPCGCAHAAAAMKKDIGKLKSQISELQQKLEESAVVTDAYRTAFEEQLGRNRELIRRLGDLTFNPVQMSKAEKAKAAVKWLIKQLNEDESIFPPRTRSFQASGDGTSSKPHDRTISNPALQQAFNSDMEQLFAEVSESREIGASPGFHLVNGVDLDKSTEEQLIQMLAEMVSDKTEALVHSRLTAKRLAKRNSELEQKLRAVTDGTDEVFHDAK